MNTNIVGYLLLALVVGIIFGALLYGKFHAQLQAQVAEREEQLRTGWETLVARAHTERDRLFALLHPAKSPVVAAPPAPVDGLAALRQDLSQMQQASATAQTNPQTGG